jgi:hypothetical protein
MNYRDAANLQRTEFSKNLLQHTDGTTNKIIVSICMEPDGTTSIYKAGILSDNDVKIVLSKAMNDIAEKIISLN